MKKDYQSILLNKGIKLKRFNFSDLRKKLSCSDYGGAITNYYKAWQDLIISGRLQKLSSGKYRINQ